MKFYARPKGCHIHSSLICPMLNGEQFKYYKYKEISLDEAAKRNLELCLCVYEDLYFIKRHIDITQLKYILEDV